jgi:hypothetical protein
MKIKIHTYPDGPADNLDPYDEILRIDGNGRFVVQQAGEGLVEGDQYALSPQQQLPARKAEDVLDFIASRRLRFTWVDALAPGSTGPLGEDSLIICDHKLDDIHKSSFDPAVDKRSTVLREAVEFIMDQEEL